MCYYLGSNYRGNSTMAEYVTQSECEARRKEITDENKKQTEQLSKINGRLEALTVSVQNQVAQNKWLMGIIGTVLDRDKAKKTVTLLTTHGVVTVKIFGGVFAQYDKQISERGADGKKHVIEKSMFSRGNKIIVSGVRDGDSFRAKKYNKTSWHLIEQITDVDELGQITIHARGEE